MIAPKALPLAALALTLSLAAFAGGAGAAEVAPEPGPAAQPLPPAPPFALVPDRAPALRADRTSRCFDRGDGRRWRAQCDSTTRTCLVAPDTELASDGEARGPLDRVPACVAPGWREADLVGQGYTVRPALAEAPPGWRRDERQRSMQVDFDLDRRLWLGAGWAAGNLPWSQKGQAEAGLRLDFPVPFAGAPALLRLHALETQVSFDGDRTDFTLLSLDLSRAYPNPLLRITTLLGAPRRFDLPLAVGFWLEGVHAETLRVKSHWYDRLTYAAAAITVDLWRSRDFASYLRLRGGAGWETAQQLEGGAVTPLAAADLEATLDRGGLHSVRASVVQEWIRPSGRGAFQPTDLRAPRLSADRQRTTGRLEYEWILLAVNDQPVSLVLEGRTQKRNDVPGLDAGWLGQGTASLRVNLFAPPRRAAPSQDAL